MKILVTNILIIIHLGAFAQVLKPQINAPFEAAQEGENHVSEIQNTTCKGLYKIDPEETVWVRRLQHIGIKHGSEKGAEMDSIKHEKALLKLKKVKGTGTIGNSKAVKPVLNTNFNGNAYDFSTPPDNAMAISNGGIIVSCINSTINYYQSNGTLIAASSFNSLVNDPTLNGSFFDPKVIYDSGSDRFIFVVLHDSQSSSSRVVIGFSQTNDPQNGWWIYNLTGNPLNDGSWFDFPHVAVSNDELFVTGNLFFDVGGSNQSVIYQIPKNSGYSGATINWQFWDNISGSPFTLLPVGLGQQGNYGPGIYLVSSRSFGGSSYSYYDLTNNIAGSPTLVRRTATASNYSPAANADQGGTADELQTNDCRALSGFFLDNTIHFVHSTDVGSGWSGVRYNRLNVISRTNVSSNFGNSGVADYAFPAVASFSTSATDKSVLIAYEEVTPSGFPGVSVVNCDDNLNWSQPTLVKAGDGFVDILPALDERWGDYIGISREHSAPSETVWLASGYGSFSNRFNNRVAKITSAPGPNAEFSGTPLSGDAPLTVTFKDLSTNSTGRTWTFTGGNPSSSTLDSVQVVYLNPGKYDVELEATNPNGFDIETKSEYVEVTQSTVGVNEKSVGNNVRVYPQPATQEFNVEFFIENGAYIDVQIMDMKGSVVNNLFKGWARGGKNRFSFNKAPLQPGVYFIQIKTSQKILVHEKLLIGA